MLTSSVKRDTLYPRISHGSRDSFLSRELRQSESRPGIFFDFPLSGKTLR
jgi:hypothetical protein